MEVAGCGTGIMLIKREAIATMLKTLPGISDTKAKTTSPLAAGLDRLIRAFDNIEVDGVPLMDDFAFCHRWHVLCKGEIWARADQSVTHIGLHKFAASYMDAGGGGPRITVSNVGLVKSGNGKTGLAAKVVPARSAPQLKGKLGGK